MHAKELRLCLLHVSVCPVCSCASWRNCRCYPQEYHSPQGLSLEEVWESSSLPTVAMRCYKQKA